MLSYRNVAGGLKIVTPNRTKGLPRAWWRGKNSCAKEDGNVAGFVAIGFNSRVSVRPHDVVRSHSGFGRRRAGGRAGSPRLRQNRSEERRVGKECRVRGTAAR